MRRKEVLAFAKMAPCLVGMEACGSAHYWAREIAKLGHSVKLKHNRPDHFFCSTAPEAFFRRDRKRTGRRAQTLSSAFRRSPQGLVLI